MDKLEWTGERYVPWADDFNTAYEHLHRYQFAKEFVDGKIVLDLASGEGYGSFLLSASAASVTGIDIDALSVRHASAKYQRDNLTFLQGSITAVPIEGEQLFDIIVCFEAIEHVEDHEALLREVKRLLKSDGVFIVSSPNKRIYSDLPNYVNPYHVKELYFEEFKDLLLANFGTSYIYGQKVYPASSLFPLFEGAELSREYIIEMGENKEFVFLPPDQRVARYFIALATDAALPAEKLVGHSALLDQSESLIRQCNGRIGQLKGALQQKEEQFALLRQQLDEQQHKLQIAEKEFKEKGEFVLNEFRSKCLEVVTHDVSVMALEDQKSTLMDTNNILKGLLDDKTRDLERVREDLAELEVNYRDKCGEMSRTISDFKGQVAERDRRIEEHAAAVANLNREITLERRRLEDLSEANQNLKGMFEDKARDLERAREYLAEVEVNYRDKCGEMSRTIGDFKEQAVERDRRIEEHAATVAHLNREITLERRRTEDLSEANQILKSVLADRNRDIDLAREGLSELEVRYRDKCHEMSGTLSELRQLTAKSLDLEQELQTKCSDIAAKELEIVASHRRIEEHDAAVARLNGEITLERRRLAEHLAESEDQLLQRNTTIGEQGKELLAKEDSMKTLEEELVKLLEAENANRQCYLQQLHEKDKELKGKDQRIEDLLNSRSWKITAPLRAVLKTKAKN